VAISKLPNPPGLPCPPTSSAPPADAPSPVQPSPSPHTPPPPASPDPQASQLRSSHPLSPRSGARAQPLVRPQAKASASFSTARASPREGQLSPLHRVGSWGKNKTKKTAVQNKHKPLTVHRQLLFWNGFPTQWRSGQRAQEVKELEGSVILRVQHCPRPGCKRANRALARARIGSHSALHAPGPTPEPVLADRTCRCVAGRRFHVSLAAPLLALRPSLSLAWPSAPTSTLNTKP
jgi:hypothetical protein